MDIEDEIEKFKKKWGWDFNHVVKTFSSTSAVPEQEIDLETVLRESRDRLEELDRLIEAIEKED